MTNRQLACAILTSDTAVFRAIGSLVEAGFATESIRVLLSDGDTEQDELQVQLRTGIRRMLPIGAIVGLLGGIALVLHGGQTGPQLGAQLVAGAATGGFLGALTGIVLGLGHWEHFVDLPDTGTEVHPMLVAVELGGSERGKVAEQAFRSAGADQLRFCSDDEAWDFIEGASEPSA
jgi:hypothetical protein